MVAIKKQSNYWWFEGHNNNKRSPWLQSTITELEEKTEAMLKVIDDDADSFAQRAEMFYKKRPELIDMVQDFYRSHRSLAEKFDLAKSDSAPRLSTTFPLTKTRPEQTTKIMASQESYDTHYETFDSDVSAESEVDDPDQENEEMMKLRDEIANLNEENKRQKDQLLQKDEEKREAIRQLSISVEMVRDENVMLRRKFVIVRETCPRKKNNFGFNIFKGMFFGK